MTTREVHCAKALFTLLKLRCQNECDTSQATERVRSRQRLWASQNRSSAEGEPRAAGKSSRPRREAPLDRSRSISGALHGAAGRVADWKRARFEPADG